MCIYVCSLECRFLLWPKSLESLALELQVVLNPLMRVLRAEPGSYARAVCALNHWAIAPAPV